MELLEAFKGSPLAAFGAALVVALITTPLVGRLALRCQAVSHPDTRRLEARPVPQWGGLAVFGAVALAALLWRQPSLGDIRLLSPSGEHATVQQTASQLHLSTVFFGTGFLILLLGMWDDRTELRPLLKLSGQVLIAGLLWYGGVRIRALPLTAGTHLLSEPVSLVLTMLWVLGLTNAMNLIDGVDGLAAGVAGIAAGSLAVVEHMKSATWAAAAAAAVSGGCFGFLPYNFSPARVYLGDTGAMLLGFWLAAIAVTAAAKTAAATTLLVPMLMLGVPVVDTLWAVVRRSLAGQPVWQADRGHLHHRLLARGFTARKTTLILYSITALLGAVAILLASR